MISVISRLIDRLRGQGLQDRALALAVVCGLVGASLVVRFLLQPVFGGDHVYAICFPAVLLVAFLAGRRAALLAMALAGVLACWMFQPPAFHLKLEASSLTPLILFVANATVSIYLISGLNEALMKLAREQGRAEAAARHNADLFCELNERVASHLQLVAGVLSLQAEGEPEACVAQALLKASDTSLMLSRAHRDCCGRGDELVEFVPFARRLVEAKLASRGLPRTAIMLTGEDLSLPSDQVTSLGAALLECLEVLLSRRDPVRLELQLSRRGEGVALRVAELDADGAAFTELEDGYLLQAVIEQLGARLSFAVDERGGALEIVFRPGARSAGRRLDSVTLH